MVDSSQSVVEAEEVREIAIVRDGLVGFVLGAAIGVAAGLIGVGGGEFRIPVLLHALRLPVKVAAGMNMVIGLFVVVLGVWRRWGQAPLSRENLTLAGVMAAASLVGAILGVRQAHRFASPMVKKIVCVYLLIVGAWMIIEAATHSEHVLLAPHGIAALALAAVMAFAIAVVSGTLGVAGGEMRIPALMYLFALPLKPVAGTVSLLVSIPTVAAGAVAYRRMGHIPNRALMVAVVMGLGSLVGVLVGVQLLPAVNEHWLKGVLGAILLAATACLMLPGFFNRIKSEPTYTDG